MARSLRRSDTGSNPRCTRATTIACSFDAAAKRLHVTPRRSVNGSKHLSSGWARYWCWGPWFDQASQLDHHGYQRLSRSSGLHRPRCLRAPDPRASGGAVGARSCGATGFEVVGCENNSCRECQLSTQAPRDAVRLWPVAGGHYLAEGFDQWAASPLSANHLGTVAARSRVYTWFASHVSIGAQRSR